MSKLTQRLWSLIASIALITCLAACDVRTEPQWAIYFERANKISTQRDYEPWDKQAELVFNESSKYGGKLPPPSPGYGWTYPSALHDLGNTYRLEKKSEKAERFYLRALELENIDHPGQSNGVYRRDLIDALVTNGKIKAALEQQKLLIEAIEKELQTPTYKGSPSHEQWLEKEQAKLAEMEKQVP
ncbi:MAG: tetratricopeptide repeat protein [Candidatus Obscuribacterales bacterium]